MFLWLLNEAQEYIDKSIGEEFTHEYSSQVSWVSQWTILNIIV